MMKRREFKLILLSFFTRQQTNILYSNGENFLLKYKQIIRAWKQKETESEGMYFWGRKRPQRGDVRVEGGMKGLMMMRIPKKCYFSAKLRRIVAWKMTLILGDSRHSLLRLGLTIVFIFFSFYIFLFTFDLRLMRI